MSLVYWSYNGPIFTYEDIQKKEKIILKYTDSVHSCKFVQILIPRGGVGFTMGVYIYDIMMLGIG